MGLRFDDRSPVATDHRLEGDTSTSVGLWIEEHLDMAHTLRRGLGQIGERKIAEVLHSDEHVHRRVVDGEKTGQRIELIGGLHLGHGLLGQLHVVASGEGELQGGRECALEMHVKLAFRQAGDERREVWSQVSGNHVGGHLADRINSAPHARPAQRWCDNVFTHRPVAFSPL